MGINILNIPKTKIANMTNGILAIISKNTINILFIIILPFKIILYSILF